MLNEIHATPMCFNALMTLVAEVPATRIANDKSRFPAGIEVPVITGWLFHVVSFLTHIGLEQVTFT